MIFDLDGNHAILPESTDFPQYEEPPQPESVLAGQHAIQPELDDLPQHEEPPLLETMSNGDRDYMSAAHIHVEASASASMCTETMFDSYTNRLTTLDGSNSSGLANARACLSVAKKQAHLRELRLRVPTVFGGIVFIIASTLLVAISDLFSPLYALGSCLGAFGTYCFLMALLPTDMRVVPKVCTFIVIPILLCYILVIVYYVGVYSSTIGKGDCMVDEHTWPCWFILVLLAKRCIDALPVLLMILKIISALKQKASAEILICKIWSGVGWVLLTPGFAYIPIVMVSFAACPFIKSVGIFATGAPLFSTGLLLVLAPDVGRRLQFWFMSRGTAAVAAAGLAELLVGQEIEDVLASARETFSFVRADQVFRQELEGNCSNPALSKLSRRGRIGQVDAFVSHSWHDDADYKWVALQELRTEFKAAHTREPKLWIDKYCINQNDISTSLACLPVYLAGCTQLWILCGKTYLERLWCVVEILIFIEMGGQMANLHVKLLGDLDKGNEKGGEVEKERPSMTSNASLVNLISRFNPRSARCSTQHDTERLQAVLEVTGDARICELVRNVFKPKARTSCAIPI